MLDEEHNMMNENYNMIGYYCEEKTGHGSIEIAQWFTSVEDIFNSFLHLKQ
jgi:hypothetical protein